MKPSFLVHHLLAIPSESFPRQTNPGRGPCTLQADLSPGSVPHFLPASSGLCVFFGGWGGGGYPPYSEFSFAESIPLKNILYVGHMYKKIYESRKENSTNFLKPDIMVMLLKHHIPFLTPCPYLIICPKKMPHGDPQS